jgi:hypothetical protein
VKSITLSAPEGFEFAGEPRIIKHGEWYAWLFNGKFTPDYNLGDGQTINEYYPLRKLLKPVPNADCIVTVLDVYGAIPEIADDFEYVGFGITRPNSATHWIDVMGRKLRDAQLELLIGGPRIWIRFIGDAK